jgi:FAD/FMN-containing dehydrogenase
MTSASRFIAFDNNSGVLQLEAGVTVREVQALFSPIGWMMPVTPGTEFVTIGGAIANDVHGKNHHVAGSIGNHLLGIEILRTDGELITCTPTENIDWFRATIGGMGLTGIILNATIQLKRTKGPWIDAEDVVFESLPEFFALSSESQATHEYSVSWIDSTTDGGRRGIFTRGNTASDQSGSAPTERVFDFVVRPPFSLVNPVTLRTFNKLYFHAKKSLATSSRIHYRPFFYPLDRIRNWNRLYGRRGFHQYQSVIPPFEAEAATQEMLKEIARSGQGSFLGVLKTFGDMEPAGMMSFPRDGVTLAIDFPERGAKTEKLFSRLDSIVGEAGGRLYPAKDDRMPRSMFEEGYSNLHEFLKFRDPGLTSELSRRLIGD